MNPPRPRRARLPSMTAEQASFCIDFLDWLMNVIWDAHEDDLLELLADQGYAVRPPRDAVWWCGNADPAADDEDIPF